MNFKSVKRWFLQLIVVLAKCSQNIKNWQLTFSEITSVANYLFFQNYKNPFKSKSLPLVECMTVTSEVRNWKSLNLKNLWSVEASRSEDGKSRFSDTRHLTNAFQPRIGFRLALGRSQDTCIPIKELT